MPSGITFNQMYANNSRGGLQAENIQFNYDDKLKLNASYGTYRPTNFSQLVYYGVVGPGIWAPDSSPLRGFNIKGSYDDTFNFELIQAENLTWTGACPSHVFTFDSPYDIFASSYYTNT